MKEKKSQKGEMLIETVVAMAIFAIMVTSFFGVYKAFSGASKRETAYIFFESVCLSIDDYYDTFGREFWAQEYFGENLNIVSDLHSTMILQRYDSNFQLLNNRDPFYRYYLTGEYVDGEFILNIEDRETGYFIIKDLNYGKSLADSKHDINYINDISKMNSDIKKLQPTETRYGEDD